MKEHKKKQTENSIITENSDSSEIENKDEFSEFDKETAKELVKKAEESKDAGKNGKKQPFVKRGNADRNIYRLLVAIIAVGVCLLVVATVGMVGTVFSIDTDKETTTAAPSAQPQQTTVPAVVTTAPENSPQNQGESFSADGSGTSAPSTDGEWLGFFNDSLNKIKTQGPSFEKSKQTAVLDIELSNSLAQAYVSVAKDKFLSDETVKTNIAKGDTASAAGAVSPDGASFVSNLSLNDIKSITHSQDGNGNYVIRVDMNDATNPDSGSSYAKIFQFITVDDVMNTYAPNMNATVDRNNVTVEFTGCYAEAVISPDGAVLSYATNVSANMILKDAKVSVVTTDLNVTLKSNTVYQNFVW